MQLLQGTHSYILIEIENSDRKLINRAKEFKVDKILLLKIYYGKL